MLTYQEREYLKLIRGSLLSVAYLSIIYSLPYAIWMIYSFSVYIHCFSAVQMLSRNNEYFGRKKMNFKVPKSRLAQPVSEL